MEAKYAFMYDFKLKNIILQAIGFQKSIERQLINNGDQAAYNEEVKKVLERGHIRGSSTF